MGAKMNFDARMKGLEAQVKKAKQQALIEYAQGEVRDVQRRIVTGKTDPYGTRWAPWSFSTMRSRMRDGTIGGGLLYKTGQLLRSFVAHIRGDEVSIESNVPYAAYLEQGRANMPPRKIVDLGSKLSFNRLAKILQKHLGQIK